MSWVDFQELAPPLPRFVLCDIEAIVIPEEDSINVEIVSIKTDPTNRELAPFLKKDAEYTLKTILRGHYVWFLSSMEKENA